MYIKVCCVCVKKWHRAPFSIKNRSQAITYAPMSLPVTPSEITALGLTGRGPRSANPTCYLGKEMMQRVDRLGDTTCCIRSTWLRTPKVITYQKFFQGILTSRKAFMCLCILVLPELPRSIWPSRRLEDPVPVTHLSPEDSTVGQPKQNDWKEPLSELPEGHRLTWMTVAPWPS